MTQRDTIQIRRNEGIFPAKTPFSAVYLGMLTIDKITATFSTPYIKSPFTQGDRFAAALATLAAGLEAGKIWNVEFTNAKYYVSSACEHAQHIAADGARTDETRNLPSSDPRHKIGYAFGMNQAAKLSRDLKKLWKKFPGAFTPGIVTYVETLDQIATLNDYLKQFKAIIVKGRRPVEKTEEQLRDETFNTGVCAICANRQKLDDSVNMVMHGYQMSGYNHSGYRMGKCFGVGYKPYELSNEANVAYAPVLENYRKDVAQAIRTWKSGKITSVEVTRDKWEAGRRVEFKVTLTLAENPIEFNSEKENRVARLESELRMIKSDIKINDAKIKQWVLTPLKYGRVIMLEHAVAHIGTRDAQGWLICDRDTRNAVFTLENAKWDLEAMGYPVNNRFWDEQRREYDASIAEVQS